MQTVENKLGRAQPENIAKRSSGTLTLDEQSKLIRRIGFRNPHIVPPEELTPEYKRLRFLKFRADRGDFEQDGLGRLKNSHNPTATPIQRSELNLIPKA